MPQGTERLIVDLNDGAGQADLYMRLDQAPTSSTYTHHSSAEGANDRIAFNDPTPGWWYILLTSESAFTGVNIVAEFADRYVWEYDGTPIELYNDEPVDGIGVTEGGEIFFFAELDEPGNMLQIETYGGSGDIMLQVEGLQFELDFFEGGRPGREMEASTEPFDIYSGKDGTNHLMTIEFPMNGRVDVVLTGLSDAEEISLVARWDESDFPIEPIEPSDPIEPGSAPTCAEEATMMFEDLDVNGDGTVDQIEIKTVDGEEIDFKSMDINADGAYEYRNSFKPLAPATRNCGSCSKLLHKAVGRFLPRFSKPMIGRMITTSLPLMPIETTPSVRRNLRCWRCSVQRPSTPLMATGMVSLTKRMRSPTTPLSPKTPTETVLETTRTLWQVFPTTSSTPLRAWSSSFSQASC